MKYLSVSTNIALILTTSDDIVQLRCFAKETSYFLSVFPKPSNCVIFLMGVFLLSVVVDIQRRRLHRHFLPKNFRSIPQIPSQFTFSLSLSLSPSHSLSLSLTHTRISSLSQFLSTIYDKVFCEMECVKVGVTPSRHLEWIDLLTIGSQKM